MSPPARRTAIADVSWYAYSIDKKISESTAARPKTDRGLQSILSHNGVYVKRLCNHADSRFSIACGEYPQAEESAGLKRSFERFFHKGLGEEQRSHRLVRLVFPPTIRGLVARSRYRLSVIPAHDLRGVRGKFSGKKRIGPIAQSEEMRMEKAVAALVGEGGSQPPFCGRRALFVERLRYDDLLDPVCAKAGESQDSGRQRRVRGLCHEALLNEAVNSYRRW